MADPAGTPNPFLRTRLTGLSSGVRMLVILTVALLPLGLLALIASIRSADNNRRQHELDAGIIAAQAARQIDMILVRDARLLAATMRTVRPAPVPCRQLLAEVAEAVGDREARYAVYNARERRRCASDPSQLQAPAPRTAEGTDIDLVEKPPTVRFTITTAADGSYATGDIPLSSLVRAVEGLTRSHGAFLVQGSTRLNLTHPDRPSALDHRVTVMAPIAGGQMALAMTVNVATVSAAEVLLVLLPMLMWLAGAIIGWFVVERSLLRPLARLERAVSGHRAGDRQFEIPRLATPAHEIRNLAEAFRAAVEDQARHDAELEAGILRQAKLTREVHHRVKNNLQVVASLTNLHARGTSGEVARAYATIQRRVDALAVVHRNHYAEMEENRGINLRTLVAELAGNLRASADSEPGVTITINMVPAWVTQDVAVPVAFLCTEIIELVMDCDPAGQIALALVPAGPGRMTLSIEAAGLSGQACSDHPSRERFERIILGLSRQLRAPLLHDQEAGRYSIDVSVLEKSDIA